ncbi:alpha,alpha-trehalase [Flammeovirgaceae bacterium 311]|nr:alpha,alpha-trehalase [Flammeovirgaceae bacterium 311]
MKTRLILLFLFSSLILSAQHKTETYKPKYAAKWSEINSYVRSRWDNELNKSDNLPHIYVGAFPGLPFMFYWDTYFTNVGLNIHEMDAMAAGNTENLLYVVDQYGYMGNAAVTSWGMNRSQPPYLSAMVRNMFESTGAKDTAFLKKAYPILKKEYLFWTDTSLNAIEQHNTPIQGLQRFYHHAKEDEILTLFEELATRFSISKDISDAEKIKVTIPYLVEAASGMDFTTRFEQRAPDFIAVELNTLLYVYEKNFSWMVDLLKLKGEPDWNTIAERRKRLVNQYCWNEERGLFLDYDFVNKRSSKVAAVTTFQPLWAGMASKEQAARVVSNMPLFESEWGMATTEKAGEIKPHQWGETSVWAPMQMLTVAGLDKYGYKKEAKRIASKYLDLLARNYLTPTPAEAVKKGVNITREPGHLYEKYRIDGTINDHEYTANTMMGWTGGTAAFCYSYLFPAN